ncbi:Na+/H+ antiporter NhaC family protein [Leuconostoc gasicomitatum]|uniref:Sodium:proton antiporter n=1 Tax=Leuconostoc gasicomitatum TaxID=115778 RepID=A0A9Q3SVS3_9LACO|nr:Na+/H+ antiporter NhaC family protein [Leuconostoc gasicomitatum]MBZ5962675.1 sodium:proton antiporter [Leuconostoc gasicomitatum]
MNNKLSTGTSVLLVVATITILAIGVIGFGLAPIAPILLAIGMIMIVARFSGVSWQDSQKALIKGVESGLTPLFLFLLIGSLIALWLATGVIPTMIWVGFKVLTPALVAGIILSGAIFGDKNSPLSDSTNLASAISETDLFAHIKNLMWTTVPAWILTFIVTILLGFGHHVDAAATHQITALLPQLEPTWWTIVPLGLLVVTAWFKMPAIPALMINVLVSSVMFLTQHAITTWAKLLVDGFQTTSTNPTLMALLNRGGMSAMMTTIMMVMLALALGGLLSGLGILNRVMAPIVSHLRTQRSIVLATLVTGIGANFLVGEQYLATILPGQLFKESFKKAKLSPLALGRTIEDSGTVINYLVPWGVAGSFAAQTLGVPVLEFAPFTLFALLSPIMSFLSAMTGIGLKQEQ